MPSSFTSNNATRLPTAERRVIARVGGQVDIAHTLTNLLGTGHVTFAGLGHDLLDNSPHPVVFRNGSWVTERYLFVANKAYDASTNLPVPVDDTIARLNTEADEQLALSDLITANDLVPRVRKWLQAGSTSHERP